MEIKHAKDIKQGKLFSALIYAPPGSGKTSTLKYLSGKTLVIDFDRTTDVLAGSDNIDIVYADIHHPNLAAKKMLKEIHDTMIADYDNVVLDNISEFERAWLGEKGRDGKNSGVPELQHYNQYGFYLTDMIRYINSWPGVNKVYTAWEATQQVTAPSGQTYNQFVPQLRPSILNEVMGLMNLVARLVISDKTGERGFILTPSNATFAKNQVDQREFSLQQDLFKFGGDENLPTPSIPEKAGKSSKK